MNKLEQLVSGLTFGVEKLMPFAPIIASAIMCRSAAIVNEKLIRTVC